MPFTARVSSAKLETNYVATSLSMSPMSTKNKSGPRTDPCGTPDLTYAGILFIPLTTTACLRLVRKACNHLPIVTVLHSTAFHCFIVYVQHSKGYMSSVIILALKVVRP